MPRFLQVLLALALLLRGACAQFGYDTVTYHGVAPAVHQANVSSLAAQGYRMTSLAVAGGHVATNYSAIWVRQSGPAWVTADGMTESQLATQDVAWRLQGYRPKLLTASTAGSSPVFAAIYVNDGVDAVFETGLGTYPLGVEVESQRAAGRRMVSCAVYATPGQTTLYAPLFEAVDNVDWGHHVSTVASAFPGHAAAFADAECRPAFLATNEAGRHLSIWHDDKVGGWALVSDRTAARSSRPTNWRCRRRASRHCVSPRAAAARRRASPGCSCSG